MIRPPNAAIRLFAIALVAMLLAACSPQAGALGSPATPPPTGDASVEVPSDDATPGVESPSQSSLAPSPSPSASSSPASAEPSPTTAAPTTRPTARPTTAPAGSTIVRAYFFLGSFTDNAGLVPVLREVPETVAVATAAVRQLLRGPNDAELGARPAMYTDIPDGTRLLGLTIKGGVATVDLSQEFGAGGDRASLLGRLAQVVYTVTQFRTVDLVMFELDGQPVSTLGPGSPALDHGVNRADFRGQLPAIFVDRPAWGAALGNPGRVSGLANVFEATFRVQLRDANDRVLVDRQVMASCGTGCWGTFRVDLDYSVGKPQYGTLRVYDRSAKDGTPENVTEYPVWLTKAGS